MIAPSLKRGAIIWFLDHHMGMHRCTLDTKTCDHSILYYGCHTVLFYDKPQTVHGKFCFCDDKTKAFERLLGKVNVQTW